MGPLHGDHVSLFLGVLSTTSQFVTALSDRSRFIFHVPGLDLNVVRYLASATQTQIYFVTCMSVESGLSDDPTEDKTIGM